MPEGPEIYLAAQQVNQTVANRPIDLISDYPVLNSVVKKLKNVTIKNVRARSKAMLTEFSNGVILYSHNQLYGEWVVHSAEQDLLAKQVRLIIKTPQHRVVLYSATDFAWLTVDTIDSHPYLAKLGPEVLDPAVDFHLIATRLAQFPRRVVADALLSQQVLAGLGNYLRADILFVSKINPLTKIGALTPSQLTRLAKACKLLPKRSVEQAGVIRTNAQYKAGRKAGLDFEASRFYVFDREGQPCWDCASTITRVTQGGRGLFFCASCQR